MPNAESIHRVPGLPSRAQTMGTQSTLSLVTLGVHYFTTSQSSLLPTLPSSAYTRQLHQILRDAAHLCGNSDRLLAPKPSPEPVDEDDYGRDDPLFKQHDRSGMFIACSSSLS